MEFELTVGYASDCKNILVQIDEHTVVADGGDRSQPSPGALFIAGLAACTASTARGYCFRNDLPFPTAVKAKLSFDDDTHIVSTVSFEVQVPPDFPQERLEALQRAAEACTVKKYWLSPPQFTTSVTTLQTIPEIRTQ
jgi:putative redox protein